MILLIGACLVMGCAGRKNDTAPTPTTAAAAAPATSPAGSTAVQASALPAQATATPVPTPGTIAGNTDAGLFDLDPSLLNLSGEGQDEGGFPETGLPTPTVD